VLENVFDGHGFVGMGPFQGWRKGNQVGVIQGQDLIEGFLIGHQVLLDECRSCLLQVALSHGQTVAQRKVGVETQAPGIGHGEQEQIEGTGGMAEPVDVSITDQALIDPAELFGHLPEPGERDGSFVHVCGLLFDWVND